MEITILTWEFRLGRYNLIVPYAVTLIQGDGIGPEVANAACRVIDATGIPIDWHRIELSSEIIQSAGQVLPQYVETKIGALPDPAAGVRLTRLNGPAAVGLAGLQLAAAHHLAAAAGQSQQ